MKGTARRFGSRFPPPRPWLPTLRPSPFPPDPSLILKTGPSKTELAGIEAALSVLGRHIELSVA